jgi:hypothetical protein
MDDWNTLSLRTGSTTGSTHISQRSMKEISLSTAIELHDLDIIREAARSRDGLVVSDLRRQIWPLLLQMEAEDSPKSISNIDSLNLPEYRDELQIDLDVNRSFVHYPLTISTTEKDQLRTMLRQILVKFFRNYPSLCYYQGLHDICSVFLLVFKDEQETFSFFSQFALRYLRDFMLPSIDSSIGTLKLIPELLGWIDNDLYQSLGMKTISPFFCLSPIITLFAHDLKALNSLSLIFDQVLSYQSLDVLFLIYVKLLSNKKGAILEKIDSVGDDGVFDRTDLVHSILSKFLDNTNVEDINEVLIDLPTYFDKYPLRRLKSFKELNKYSALKVPTSTSKSFEDLIELQIKLSEKKSLSSGSLMLQNLLPKIKASNYQLLKLTLTIGIISIFINLFLQRKESLGRVSTYLNFGKTYLGVGLIQPLEEFWYSHTRI